MWAQAICAVVGIWLMAAPDVLGYSGPAEKIDRIAGPMIASLAVTALWQVTRAVRWLNVGLGLALLLVPWMLGYEPGALVNSLLCGVAVTALSSVRGRRRHPQGGGWRVLRGNRLSPS